MALLAVAASLQWVLLAVLLLPMCAATGDEQPEIHVALAGAARLIKRVRAWLRRARNRIVNIDAANAWRANGLHGFKLPPKPPPPAQKRQAESQPPAVCQPCKKPHVDPEARHPADPRNDDWLQDPGIKDWCFTRDGYVYCSGCKQQKQKSKFANGKPVSDQWIKSRAN